MTVDRVTDSEKRDDLSDRRETDERRSDEIFFGDADRRSAARRQGLARKLTCGILFSTPGAVAEVEDWLDDHCKGDWSLNIEGMDDDLVKKSLKILFELETDKQRFVTTHIA